MTDGLSDGRTEDRFTFICRDKSICKVKPHNARWRLLGIDPASQIMIAGLDSAAVPFGGLGPWLWEFVTIATHVYEIHSVVLIIL